VADIWTVSNWSLGDADPALFVPAFRKFADAATAVGGCSRGDDPAGDGRPRACRGRASLGESAEAVANWTQVQRQHADELLALVPEGGSAAVLTKVADLGPGGIEPG
jgi:hypothetical protein